MSIFRDMEQADIEYLSKLDRVTVLLHPLRLQIMELAIEGTSGTDAARRLGLPRQMVNYHVQALERAGFLVLDGEVRRRNMVERRVRASARSYVLGPDLLGRLSAAKRRAPDPATPQALLSLAARLQSDVSSLPPRSPVLSLSTKLRFSSPQRRHDFVQALGAAVGEVIRSFGSDDVSVPGEGEAFGLVLGLYPLPRHPTRQPEGDQR
jgi:biotin operon repressor